MDKQLEKQINVYDATGEELSNVMKKFVFLSLFFYV